MRTLFPRKACCALVLSLITVPAHAVDQNVELSATVTSSCTLSGSTAPSALTATIPVNAGQVSTSPITLEIPIACNTPPKLWLTTVKGGMKGPTALSGTANRIDYIASISSAWYLPISLDTEPLAGQTTTEDYVPSGAPNGNLSLTITPKQPALPLRNGTYTDTLRVTVAPSQ
jgi:hypothetical protein